MPMRPSKTTPMIKQYLSIKERYADTILFYRMGDFYEMFFEDAELASKALDITLTSRNKNEAKPVPMCGVPYRAAQGYIARLINEGFKVAICDQVEDPAAAKGLVKREVVRIVTPGMVVDDELLDAKTNNFILAAVIQGHLAGLAYLDISTGTFRITQTDDLDLIIDEIRRIAPKEVLLPEAAQNDRAYRAISDAVGQVAVSFMADRFFERARCRERVLNQLNTISLEGFGCEHRPCAVSAAGALLQYVGETQKQKVDHLNRMESYTLDHFLFIDDQSCKNLELHQNISTGGRRGTLLSIMDTTVTAMGGRQLRTRLRYPLTAVDDIDACLNAVAEACEQPHQMRALREQLKAVYDLERLASKIVMGQTNARDLLGLKKSLQALPHLQLLLETFHSSLYQTEGAAVTDSDLKKLDALAQILERAVLEDAPPAVNEGGIIKPEYHDELNELVRVSRDGKGFLAALEAEEKASTGINSLKVRFNKVFGYYIEVPKTHSDKIPLNYVRKQTLVNAERYITEELKKFELKVLGAEEKRAALEYEIFKELCRMVTEHHPSIQRVAAFIGRLDCLLSFADIAERNDYTRPRLNEEGRIHIRDGRHPVVEKMISDERFVPNTVKLDNDENQILIITGPNMAGKSTVLRQVALTVIMAQMGSFVPAREANINITDKIFTRVGALDNLSSGHSTFMVEMQETANILNNATGQSLVVMDEIGRGTSTFDGLSIAWAVAEYLHDLKGHGVKTLFATHYHELTELARKKARVKNFNIAVKEWNDEIIFLRKLVEGGTNRSYGIQVARLAGIPESVVKHAKKILARIETGEPLLVDENLKFDDNGGTIHPPMQLTLFKKPKERIVEELRQLDLDALTPLDALNFLNDLKNRINTD